MTTAELSASGYPGAGCIYRGWRGRLYLKRGPCQVNANKLLRSISGIGGVSDHSLSKILAWVRQHPEVHVKLTCMQLAVTTATRIPGSHSCRHVDPGAGLQLIAAIDKQSCGGVAEYRR